MKLELKYIIVLILILAYVGLHIYEPNEQQILKGYGNDVQWKDVKSNFEDENGDTYFLGYDSYFYVDQVNRLNRNELSWSNTEDPILTSLVWADYQIFGRFVLSHYYSAIFGLLCVLIVAYLIYEFTNNSWLMLLSLLVVFSGKFFAMTAVGYLDTAILHVFYFLLHFLLTDWMMKNSGINYTIIQVIMYSVLATDWAYMNLFCLTILFVVLLFGLLFYWKNFDRKRKIFTLSVFFMFIIGAVVLFFTQNMSQITYYLHGNQSDVIELAPVYANPHFSFGWSIYLVFIIAVTILTLRYLWKNRLQPDQMQYSLLASFAFVLIGTGIILQRFFPYGWVFYVILFAIVMHDLFKDNYKSVGYFIMVFYVVLFIGYHFSNEILYNGGYLGIPLVENGLVDASHWVRDNMPKDTTIITHWSSGIFYQNFAERGAKFRSTDTMSYLFYGFLYASDEEAIMQDWKSIAGDEQQNTILIVDSTMRYKSVMDKIQGKRAAPIPSDAMFYRLFKNTAPVNFTLLFKEQGMRETYYVYNASW